MSDAETIPSSHRIRPGWSYICKTRAAHAQISSSIHLAQSCPPHNNMHAAAQHGYRRHGTKRLSHGCKRTVCIQPNRWSAQLTATDPPCHRSHKRSPSPNLRDMLTESSHNPLRAHYDPSPLPAFLVRSDRNLPTKHALAPISLPLHTPLPKPSKAARP